MFAVFVQYLKRALGFAAFPLAVYIDASGSATVRYELFPRFISRFSVSPRNPESDTVYFMSGLEPDPRRIYCNRPIRSGSSDKREAAIG